MSQDGRSDLQLLIQIYKICYSAFVLDSHSCLYIWEHHLCDLWNICGTEVEQSAEQGGLAGPESHISYSYSQILKSNSWAESHIYNIYI